MDHRFLRTSGRATKPLARRWSGRRDDRPRSRALEALLWGGGPRGHAALLGSDVSFYEQAGVPAAALAGRLADSEWEDLRNAGSEQEKARLFDVQRWLPNMYLEKTDRATMACSLEARVPYLDRAIEGAGLEQRLQAWGKQGLRRELIRLLPEVTLPDRKKGLAVDIPRLLACGLGRHLNDELYDGASLLSRCLGRAATATVAKRCLRSPTASFRVAMLGLWEELYAGDRFS
jgi:hypothetical protein